MSIITTKYRGFEIYFNEGSSRDEETWSSELGEQWYEKNKFHDIKKKIDEFIKTESKYTQKEAIYKNWSQIEKVTITSEDRDGKHVWIKYEGNKRSKVSKDDIYKYNDSNKEKICIMHDIELNIDKLTEEKDKVFDSMEKMFSKSGEINV